MFTMHFDRKKQNCILLVIRYVDITTAEDTTATPQTKYVVKVLTKADEDLEDDNDVFAT